MSQERERKLSERLPKYEPLEESVQKLIDNLKTRKTHGPEFKTAVDAFDRGTYGLHRSHLVVLAARPGNGKTALASLIAYNLADQGSSVAFVSLELTKETLLERIFCMKYNVNMTSLILGSYGNEIYQKLELFKSYCMDSKLKIIDDYCFNESELCTLFDKLNYRPDVLILDHIQHIRANHTFKTERENISEYLRCLKEYAMRYKIAVLCVSQINREGDQSPSMSNLKGSGSLEELADSIFLLHLERSDDEESQLIPAEIKIAKNRHGQLRKFKLVYNGPRYLFYNQTQTLKKEENYEIRN